MGRGRVVAICSSDGSDRAHCLNKLPSPVLRGFLVLSFVAVLSGEPFAAALPGPAPDKDNPTSIHSDESAASSVSSALPHQGRFLSASSSETAGDGTISATEYSELDAALQNSSVSLVYLLDDITVDDALSNVGRALTILGECSGHDGLCVLNGTARNRIFTVVAAGELVLEQLWLLNGAADRGGAVYSTGASLSLVTCRLTGNTASEEGGAVYVLTEESGAVRIISSNLTDNTATEGGAVYAMAHQSSEAAVRIELEESVLSGNRAGASGGGAIRMRGQAGATVILELERTDVEDSLAYSYGGGLFIDCADLIATTSGHPCTIEVALHACQFSRNFAYVHGGSLLVSVEHPDTVANVLINASTFVENVANPSSPGWGAAVATYATNPGVNLTIAGSNFTRNLAAKGGAIGHLIHPYRDVLPFRQNYSATQIFDSSFVQNRAEDLGGVVNIYHDTELFTLAFEDCVLSNNSAPYKGGVLASYVALGAELRVDLAGCSVTDNVASTGGALYGEVSKGSLTSFGIRRSQFHRNAAQEGGSVFLETLLSQEDALDSGTGSVLVIEDSSLRHNSGSRHSGSMCTRWVTVSIVRSEVISNFGRLRGGAASMESSCLYIADSRISSNRMEGQGALDLDRCRAALVNCQLDSNVAVGNGAAMSMVRSELDLSNCTMESNRAGLNGGALYITTFSAVVLRNGTHFEQNYADSSGGALFIFHACHVALESGSSISSNVANLGTGGGVAVYTSSELALRASQILFNIAATLGGGVALYTHSSMKMVDGSEASHNRATINGGNLCFTKSSIQVEQSAVVGGVAGISGGGIAAIESLVVLRDTLFSRCSAQYGGGLSAIDNSSVHIEGTTVDQMFASEGAGFAVRSAQMNMTRCQLTLNNASVFGAGVLAGRGATIEIAHTVISDNEVPRGDGAGIALADDFLHATVRNSSFIRCRAPQGHGGALFSSALANFSATSLVGLNFSENLAVSGAGPNIYWEFSSATPEDIYPTCSGCTSADADVLHTSPQTFLVMQDNVSQHGRVIHARSSYAITPPLQYLAFDVYGHISQQLTTPVLEVYSASVYEYVNLTLLGQRDANYKETGAIFDDLVVSGQPGGEYTLLFETSSIPNWEEVAVNILIEECHTGTVYDSQFQTCSDCKEGFVKFNNNSDDCTACPESMTCPGGNNFTLKDG
eukprot:gene19406-23203_t